MNPSYTVFLIDDDRAVRDALGLLLGVNDYRISVFADAESFLTALKPDWQGCVLVDIRMPGMDGLTLQRHLKTIGCTLPVIIMTGHGDVASAREAFRAEAIDFLEKPIDEARLVGAIEEAFDSISALTKETARINEFVSRATQLTPREREVMGLVVDGKHNRDIAESLGISVRTVEVHKARVMEKLQVKSLPELVRLVMGQGQ